ncbi:MAG: 50S ribosomal protein L15 [Candidatus Portnoybacteria bacterium CG10_big_fil_rev_8_21_14_0_10_44_7]|uniref:Large ribosomal subunit protein uL15 n=1 Tax=Candidatus Portnoybacteria bacterium CG10_big_fil_rev_8_21_14_0_10_44_7 TaxID=1974816 RepID=A0A2M8KII5_9BACT|nr:MAG: 50S ribosomal protein L15 [Candidatus Portnoybacteria bacterium CG10_big_fil_rev_8_21_14_0_10_44_7]
MQLHTLKKPSGLKKKKRVGRGGKRGTYSGRGLKGQKARSGGRPRPQWRDLVKKLPKQRGYRFASIKQKPHALNLAVLEKKFSAGDIVDLAKIKALGLVWTKKSRPAKVKILGQGELNKKLTVRGLPVSQTARQKIEKAGGRVI